MITLAYSVSSSILEGEKYLLASQQYMTILSPRFHNSNQCLYIASHQLRDGDILDLYRRAVAQLLLCGVTFVHYFAR